MSISTVNNYVGLYRLFGEDGLNIPEEEWTEIGPRKLRIITPWVQRDDPKEYLLKARTLSASDLIKEIKGDTGGVMRDSTPAHGDVGSRPAPLSPAQYIKKVKESPCCVCSREPPEIQIHSHHFPQTRNRGKDWKVIPLCGFCHQDAHHHPMEFLWQYKNNIFGWFYSGMVDDN